MSNQLEQLSKLYSKTKEYKIPKNPVDGEEQATIQITPLSLDDAQLLDAVTKQNLTPAESTKAMYPLLAKSLGVGEDDIKNLQLSHINEIMDIVAGSNTFNEADKAKIDKVKEMMAKNQSQ